MTRFTPFDAADYLDSDETIAAYLSAALDDDAPDLFLTAVKDVARARGMTQDAKAFTKRWHPVPSHVTTRF